MLKAIRATVLILTLSGSVFAGDIQNGLQPNPTPTPLVLVGTEQAPTEAFVVGDEGQLPIITTEITLNLVQIVLALF